MKQNDTPIAQAIITLFITLLVSVASPAFAEPTPEAALLELFAPTKPVPHVLSAAGPRGQASSIALGLSFLGAIPAFDLRYVRGLGESSALDAALSTAGVVQRLRFGARYFVTSPEATTHLALRASVLEAHSLGDPSVLVAGVGPGVVVSFDEAKFTWTVALDAAWSFLADGSTSLTHRAVQLHPAIGIELPVEPTVTLVIEASTLVTIGDGGFYAVPLVGAGLAW